MFTYLELIYFRYGNLVLLDATYKTQRQAVPLFFMVVRTNMRFLPVATFMTQNERTPNIAEALTLIKEEMAKIGFHFKSFMIDFSQAEMNALHQVFPGTHIYFS